MPVRVDQIARLHLHPGHRDIGAEFHNMNPSVRGLYGTRNKLEAFGTSIDVADAPVGYGAQSA